MKIRNLCAFVLINWLVWCILSLFYFKTGGFSGDFYGNLFTVFFIPGQMSLFAAGLFILSLPFRLIGPRALQAAATAWGGIFSLFFVLDIIVYSQYRFHISPAMLELFFGPAGREIFMFPAATWVMAFAGLVILFAAAWGLTLISKKITLSNKALIWASVFLVMILFVYNGLFAWAKFMMVPSITAQRDRLPFANPLSANRRLRKMGFEPKREPYALPARGKLAYPLNTLSCSPDKKQNVLIILVESWRSDSFTPEIMPRLTQWSKQTGANYFANHLSGGNATEAGVFSLFYSMPYAYWNDFTSRHLPPVLVSEAQTLGYTPAVYSSGKLNSPAFHQNIFAAIPNLRLESKGQTKWERDIDAVTDFETFLDKHDPKTPFFGFVFLDAPHGSDSPKEDQIFKPAGEAMNYLLLTKNTDPTPYMNRYKNSLHFTDKMIDRLLTDLQKRGLLKNTWVVLTGDHGQEINDTRNNFWGHNSNFAKYQTHVPLFVWSPSGAPAKTLTYRTNHYDVAPTVLTHVYRCANTPADYSIGQDLFDSTPRPFSIISSYTKKAVRTGDKLTVMDAYGNLEFYDENFTSISDGADPAQIGEAFKTFAKFYK